MFDILEADIVVFQETKIQRKDLSDDMVLVPGWDCYWSLPRHKKGMLASTEIHWEILLNPARVLRRGHIHQTIQMRPNPRRRGNHWHSLPAEFFDDVC